MTQFGRMLRRERKERKLLLGEMADRLGISVPYLSQIETGVKPVKEGFLKKVIAELRLSPGEENALRRAAAQAMSEFTIDLGRKASAGDRFLASQLAAGFARMSPEQKRRLRELVEDNRDG